MHIHPGTAQFGMFKLLSHKGPETAGAPVATEWTGAALATYFTPFIPVTTFTAFIELRSVTLALTPI
jgi:hypothetical protein